MCRGNPHAGNERGFARDGGLSGLQSSGHMKSNGECPSLLYIILGAINAWGGCWDPAPSRHRDWPSFQRTGIEGDVNVRSVARFKFGMTPAPVAGTLELRFFRTARKQINKQVYLHGLRTSVCNTKFPCLLSNASRDTEVVPVDVFHGTAAQTNSAEQRGWVTSAMRSGQVDKKEEQEVGRVYPQTGTRVGLRGMVGHIGVGHLLSPTVMPRIDVNEEASGPERNQAGIN
ncbi:hypothetical protein B0H11DRAFT_2376811 [Mycena galericulata]|nr:hypothetical protein B0H11DRAFT_2376811 [Mycena galericulata]